MEANVIQHNLLDMQVCVPEGWTQQEIENFAQRHYPSCTEGGWKMRMEGNPSLNGDPERVPCEDREEFVHVMLDA